MEFEGRHQTYLLRLRQMVEDQLQLHGWSKKRRVVIVRERIRGGVACERRVDGGQFKLDLAGPSVHEGDRL